MPDDKLIYEPLPDGWAYDSRQNVYFRTDGKEVRQVGWKWKACHEGAELFDYPGYAIKDLDNNYPMVRDET